MLYWGTMNRICAKDYMKRLLSKGSDGSFRMAAVLGLSLGVVLQHKEAIHPACLHDAGEVAEWDFAALQFPFHGQMLMEPISRLDINTTRGFIQGGNLRWSDLI